MRLKSKKLLLMLCLTWSINTRSQTIDAAFYAGPSLGCGATTWGGLVPPSLKQNAAISISTPLRVNEGGAVYGFFGGYEFTPYFAIEGSYLKYPKAQIIFSPDSLFAYRHDGDLSFESQTKTLALLAKLMLPLPNTPFRVFSSMGVANIYRQDELHGSPYLSPNFGGGLILHMNCTWMLQLGFNYTAGFGESELEPWNTYIPFLYSGTLGLAYRF